MTHPEEETTNKIKSECIDLCYDCRIKQGFVTVDDGAHTSLTKKCSSCFESKIILASRHWRLR